MRQRYAPVRVWSRPQARTCSQSSSVALPIGILFSLYKMSYISSTFIRKNARASFPPVFSLMPHFSYTHTLSFSTIIIASSFHSLTTIEHATSSTSHHLIVLNTRFAAFTSYNCFVRPVLVFCAFCLLSLPSLSVSLGHWPFLYTRSTVTVLVCFEYVALQTQLFHSFALHKHVVHKTVS